MKSFRVFVFKALFVFGLSLIMAGCGGGGGGGGASPVSDAKSITAFSFTSPAATGTINENAKTIAVTVPNGTNVTALDATFTTTGASVKVGGAVQVSGTTADDFTNPVTYTVTAADGSIALYTVTVTRAPSSSKAITVFSFTTPAATGTINENAKTIDVNVPYGTNVTALVATFITTGASVNIGPTAQVSGATANDFTNPVTYTVAAADGSTTSYVVTVSIVPSSAKAITAFSLLGVSGVVNEPAKTISVSLPYGTNVTTLAATFTITGASVKVGSIVQVSGTTANDFTSPVTYTVTAADSTTATYTVTVAVAASPAKAITAFSFTSPAATGTIDENTKTIAVTVPYGTNVTALAATFSTTGASVKVGSMVQVSGTTQNNFTSPVAYTVAAADSTTATYTVTVTVVANFINAYTVSGEVSGLAGTGLVLQNNGGDNIAVSANGTFTFTTAVAVGAGYSVTVKIQPTGPMQTCTANNNTGTMAGANVTSVSVICTTNAYTVSGTVAGLAGTGLVLQNNGADNLTLSANGTFSFATPVADTANYAVTVKTQPTGPSQTCTANSNTGTMAGANVTSVSVICTTNAYIVSGAVSGLAGTGLILQNNGADDLTLSTNGTFSFATPVADTANFAVTVKTQPHSLSQACTVNNGTGTVSGASISNVTVTCSTDAYTVSATISGLAGTGLVLQNNNANNLSVAANGTAVFTTQVADGANYAVTVKTQPSYPMQTCTVTSGAGTIAGVDVNVVIACATIYPRFAYVANYSDNSVSAYAVNTSTGRLTFAGKVAAGTNPYSVTVDPSGKYAYAANYGTTTVSQYTIGANGGLTAMTPATVGAGTNPIFITVDPSGKYAYVVNDSDSNISQYTIDSTGHLAAMTPATVNAGSSPNTVTVDPSGKYAYAANQGSNTVSQYTIDSTGHLAAMTPATVAAGTNPLSVTVDPSGKYTYVSNGSANISQYTIGANGGLAAMTPATVAAGTSPRAVTVDPSGKYAYVANSGDSNISQYTIDSTGHLAAMSPATVNAGFTPYYVTVDPSGKYAYAANQGSNTVSQYTIDSTGHLAANAPATVASQASPFSLAMTHGASPIAAVPKYAYVSNYGSTTVSQYTIGDDGSLSAMSPATVAAGSNPPAITVDPSGKYAYVANGSTTVSQYTIDSTGHLAAMTPATVAAGSAPASVTVDPSGKYAYVANYGGNTVSQYTIGADGSLRR